MGSRATMMGAALALAAALPAATDTLAAQDAGIRVGGGNDKQAVPTGWTVRPDGDGKAEQVKFVTMGSGYHVTLGPATLLYRQKDDGRGSFHTLATFTQTKAPPHPEAYGLFYGGKALSGAEQQYTYFLIRGDGKYLIKRRNGDQTSEIKGWTAHAAIKAENADGKATNKLEIDAKKDPAKVVFLVNGTAVDSLEIEPGDTDGIVGMRVNHNLDLHIEGFGVHR